MLPISAGETTGTAYYLFNKIRFMRCLTLKHILCVTTLACLHQDEYDALVLSRGLLQALSDLVESVYILKVAPIDRTCQELGLDFWDPKHRHFGYALFKHALLLIYHLVHTVLRNCDLMETPLPFILLDLVNGCEACDLFRHTGVD